MTQKKIDKIIIYYNDGTYEEVNPASPKEDVNKYPPLQYPPGVRGWEPPSYTVTCGAEGAGKEFT